MRNSAIRSKRSKVVTIVWVLSAIPIFIILYGKLKPHTTEQTYKSCQDNFSCEIRDYINNAYSGGRIPVILKLSSGKKIIWKCNYWEFAKYRSDLESYSGESILDKLLGKDGEKYYRTDSLYKPSNSFDFYIYINSNPDSVIYLPCSYDCDELLKEKRVKE
jgi:hypothetical protein